MSESIRILYVDDNPLDRELIRDALEKEHGGFQVIEAKSRVDFETRLVEGGYDLVLSDFNILGFEGLQVIDAVHTKNPGIPVVLVTGTGSEETAVEAMKRGAFDYVIKKPSHIRHLPHTIHAALEKKRLNEEHEKMDKALRESEGQFRATFNQAAVGIAHVAPDGRWLLVNQRLCDIVGYTCAELPGRTFQDITYPDDLETDLVYVRQMLENKIQTYSMEKRYIRKDGSLVWINLTVSLVRDASGDPQYFISVVEDIGDRKQAEDALRESEEKYRKLVENLKERYFFYSHGTDGVFTYLSPSITNILGYTQEEFARHYTEYLTDNPINKEVVLHTESSIKGIPQPPYLVEIFHKNRSIRWLEVIEVPVFDKEERIVAVEGIACDITEKKTAAEKIKQEKELTANLLMVAEAVSNTTDVDRLMDNIINCISRIMGFDVCLSYLWDNEVKVFRPSQGCGLSRETASVFRTDTLDITIKFPKMVMEKKEPVIASLQLDNGADTISGHLRAWALPWIPDAHTMVLIPITGRKGYLSLIAGIYKVPVTLTENEVKVMQGIIHQVSIALEGANLYRDSIERTMELSYKIETIQTMHEIDRAILSTLNSDEILGVATRIISRILHCEEATVAILGKEKKEFTFVAVVGIPFLPKGAALSFTDSNTVEVLETGRPQYFHDLREIDEPRFFEAELIRQGILSQIRVPITVKGDVIGVLSLGDKRPSAFTPGDLATLEKLASQIGVALSNARLISDIEELFLGTVKSLSSAIDAKSPWTAGHSERVTKYALQIGKETGLPEKELKDLELAGLLHDIGKIGTYENILDKPDTLTDDEIKIIRQHPEKGANILASIKQLIPIIPIIKHHHEHYDGTGYPNALKGEAIPLLARILTVADTVDAMGAGRPYRKGKPMDIIIAELKRCSGSHFDPKVVDVFLKVISET